MIDSSSEDEEIMDRGRFRIRRERDFRPRISVPRHVSTFREESRVDAPVAELILNRIAHAIAHHSTRSHALTPREQFLTVLRFLGTNAPYHSICNMQGPHKSTVCRTLHRVIRAINDIILQEYVRYPDNVNYVPYEFERLVGRPIDFQYDKNE